MGALAAAWRRAPALHAGAADRFAPLTGSLPPRSLLPSPSAHQVLNKEFEVLTHLARSASAFGKRDAHLAIGGLVDKVHELKHK